jgi:hypothetical protein
MHSKVYLKTKKGSNGPFFVSIDLSGREDLNLRPLRPERSALAGLSHAPIFQATGLYTTPYPLTSGKITAWLWPIQPAGR